MPTAVPPTPTSIALDGLGPRPGVARFEGHRHGGPARPDVSLFVVRTPPGAGSGLHEHPYPEVFVLLEGDAEYEVGTAVRRLSAGSVLIAPAGVPHRFRNVGAVPLLQVSVHPAGTVAQRLLAPTSATDLPTDGSRR